MRHPEERIHEARLLRQVPTEAERILWAALRRRQLGGHKFRRQAILAGHPAPFLCTRAGLAVALHTGANRTSPSDVATLTEAAADAGYRLLWIAEDEAVHDLDAVLARIKECLDR